MKKVIFITLSLAVATAGVSAQSSVARTPAVAQASINPEQRAKEATDKLNSTVQLSPDQYTKILEINKNFFTEARGAAMVGNGRPAARVASEREEKIKAILTSSQWQKVLDDIAAQKK